MDTGINLKTLFVFSPLFFVLLFSGSAAAQTAPVCGSAGDVTPGIFSAQLYRFGGPPIIDLSFSGATPPVEIWIDPGTASQLGPATFPVDGAAGLTMQISEEPLGTIHIVAFVTPGYAPVCIAVPWEPSVQEDAYPVQAQQLPASLPGTGLLLLPLAGGLACAGLGSALFHRYHR